MPGKSPAGLFARSNTLALASQIEIVATINEGRFKVEIVPATIETLWNEAISAKREQIPVPDSAARVFHPLQPLREPLVHLAFL